MVTGEQKIQILQALVIITEMTDTKWSEATLDAVVQELAAYDFNQVHKALNRVRREHKGRLTLAAILDLPSRAVVMACTRLRSAASAAAASTLTAGAASAAPWAALAAGAAGC